MELSEKFNPSDPLLFESQLTPEEKLILENAREFANTILTPKIQSAFRTEIMDESILLAMAEYQLLGTGYSTVYGGNPSTVVSKGLIAREIERIDSGYRTLFSVTHGLVMRAIDLFGSEEQKKHYLPLLIQGKLVASFALTEADQGSNPSSMKSRAVPIAKGYRLNGHKRWIGLAPHADILIYWAKDPDNKIRGFILERGLKGMHTPRIEGKLALRSAPSGEVILTDAEVSEKNLLPHAEGLKSVLTCLDASRFGIAWGAIGAAESCLQIALDYAKQRNVFEKPIAATQLVQQKLVDMQTEITLALHTCLHMSRCIDRGEGSPEMISMMKRNSAQKALNIARQARDILGGNGILDSYQVMRHMLNLEAVNTYEGTHDIHTLILGRALTGYEAFH